MWNLLEGAPSQFDRAFLQWIHEMENLLLISFADWSPSPDESREIQEYITSVGRRVPEELQFYYENIYPFDKMKNSGHKWTVQLRQYEIMWNQHLNGQGLTSQEIEDQLAAMLALWPIDCFHKYDTVGFVGSNGQLAIINLNRNSGRGFPIAIGLRNYFLVEIAVQILAEELTKVDFDQLRSDPRVVSLSGWPIENPPKHIALEVRT